jgi:hypothetical protein
MMKENQDAFIGVIEISNSIEKDGEYQREHYSKGKGKRFRPSPRGREKGRND